MDSNQGYNPYKWVICPLTRVINLHITSSLPYPEPLSRVRVAMVILEVVLFVVQVGKGMMPGLWVGWVGWKGLRVVLLLLGVVKKHQDTHTHRECFLERTKHRNMGKTNNKQNSKKSNRLLKWRLLNIFLEVRLPPFKRIIFLLLDSMRLFLFKQIRWNSWTHQPLKESWQSKGTPPRPPPPPKK